MVFGNPASHMSKTATAPTGVTFKDDHVPCRIQQREVHKLSSGVTKVRSNEKSASNDRRYEERARSVRTQRERQDSPSPSNNHHHRLGFSNVVMNKCHYFPGIFSSPKKSVTFVTPRHSKMTTVA